MKTVKDYLELGLAFVSGDKICGVTGDSSSGEMDIFDRTICAKKYSKGAVKVGADCYARARWTPSSFAWRNNDGVKPEYKGVIEFDLNGGQKCTDYVSEITWIRGLSYSVAKWRPVVLKSYDAHENKDSSFTLPVGIDSPELREAFKSLKDHLENKPPFWNKSMPSFSCPCVAVNVEVIKPTVSPKEDKTMNPSREPKAIFSTESTMFGDRLRRAAEVFESGDLDISISDGKPVYTAEMHAKNELPPVGSKVKVCIEEAGFYVDEQDARFEGKTVTVKAAFSNTESEKIVAVENEDGNCYCYIIECIKPIIKTIKVNGFDVPAPMSEAPERGSEYFVIDILDESLACSIEWEGDNSDNHWLSKGIIHSTESAAIAHAKAMLGIDPNA